MSERGVFAVDRGIFDHPIFAAEPYTEREAWLWMVSAAVWKNCRVRAGRKMISLLRGQLSFSERFLAEKWKWAKTSVRRFLDRLKNEEMVCLLADHDTTVITICNYERYAFDGIERGPRTGPLADHSRTKEEEPKKNNSKKEEAASAASPAKYVFESGIIKLNQKDFDQWKGAFIHLNLPAKLLALTEWAGQQRNWFQAVKSALAKQDAQAKADAERSKPQPFKWNGMEGVI